MKSFWYLILLLSSSFVYSQKNHSKENITIDTSIVIDEFKTNIFSNNTLFSSFYNDTLFFFEASIMDNVSSLNIVAYSTISHNYEINNLDLKFALGKDSLEGCSINDITVNDKYLVINVSKNGRWLLFFKRDKNKFSFEFELSYPKNLFSDKILFLPNGKLLGCKNYVCYEDDYYKSTNLTILDVEKREIEKSISPEFLLAGYTFFRPSNIVSVNDKSILFSQRGDYKITEYDFELNPINIIKNTEIKWDRIPQDISDSIFKSNRQAAYRMHMFSSLIGKYSSVSNIYSSENKLFVFYQKKDKPNISFYDVWIKDISGKWMLDKKDISDEKKYKKDNNTIEPFGDNIFCVGDKFIRISYKKPYLGDLSNKKYEKAFEEYASNNSLPYCIEIISFKSR